MPAFMLQFRSLVVDAPSLILERQIPATDTPIPCLVNEVQNCL